MRDQDSVLDLAFIGGGNMATAIISGIRQDQQTKSQILVVEPDAEKRTTLKKDHDIAVTDQIDQAALKKIIVLAVKPQQLQSVCESLKPSINDQLIISIAAGIKTAAIVRWLDGHQKVIRIMPNTPAQVQAGVSALFALEAVSATEKNAAQSLLQAVGSTLWLNDEAQMDAVTAISGSGPAYVFYCIEALQNAALELGLPATQANELAMKTFLGASLLASGSEDSVSTLREKVTSKGGTTEKGLAVLADRNLKGIFVETAKAAADQSVILGDMLSK